MISDNTRELDKDDVAVLFSAMVAVNTSELAELADRSLVGIGYGEALARCERAARIVAEEHREEGDDWDGVWWFEIFESAREGCLAHRLFMLDAPEEMGGGAWGAAIREIVLAWLALHQGADEEASDDE